MVVQVFQEIFFCFFLLESKEKNSINQTTRSDWVLILGIVICYSPSEIFLDFARVCFFISQKKGTIWCWLSTGLVYTDNNNHHYSPPLR